MVIKRVLSKVKGAVRKIKNEGKAAIKVAKHGARSFGKLSRLKKAAALAAAPLAPLAYMSSHGFRDPKGGAKALKGAAGAVAKVDPVGFVKAVAPFQAGAVKKDWQALKKKAGVKPK